MTDIMQPEQSAVDFTGKPFIEMSGGEKFTFLWKVVVMLATGGFAFPNIFSE